VTAENRARQHQLLARLGKILEREDIPYWLESGTLLGAVREGDHLDNHPGVDLAVDAVDLEKLLAVKSALGPRLRMSRRFNRSGRRWIDDEVIGVEVGDVIDLALRRPVSAIITVKYKRGDRHHWVDFRNCKWAESSHFEALSSVELGGHRYPAPGAPERYLEHRYGDWTQPRKDWIAEIEDGALAADDVIRAVPAYQREKLTPRVRTNVTLEGENRERMVAMLFRLMDLLERNGIKHWLEDGALLGIIRDGDLIPWDHDIDLAIPGDQAEKVARLGRRLLPRDLMIPKRTTHRWLPDSIRSLEVHNPLEMVRRVNFHIDVLAKYRFDDHYRWIDSKALKHLEPRFFDSLSSVEWRGRQMPIPSDPEEYLEWRYPNWRVPVKIFDTSLQDLTIAERGF
jgi:phosphorylcholine metabolism protein LicD